MTLKATSAGRAPTHAPPAVGWSKGPPTSGVALPERGNGARQRVHELGAGPRERDDRAVVVRVRVLVQPVRLLRGAHELAADEDVATFGEVGHRLVKLDHDPLA